MTDSEDEDDSHLTIVRIARLRVQVRCVSSKQQAELHGVLCWNMFIRPIFIANSGYGKYFPRQEGSELPG